MPFKQKDYKNNLLLLIDMYFLDKGALIIGFADKRPLIQRALYGRCPYPSDGATSKNSLNLSAFAARPHAWPRAKNRIQASVSYSLVSSLTLAVGGNRCLDG